LNVYVFEEQKNEINKEYVENLTLHTGINYILKNIKLKQNK